MWETFEGILASRHPWSAMFVLTAGVILGAIISIYWTIKAQRPRLVVSGGGSGGNDQQQRWSVSVVNRPSFFGVPLDGESARDVHAHLQLRDKGSAAYLVYWRDHPGDPRTTLEPGQQRSLELFRWSRGAKGYFVVDQGGDAIARFESRELKFVLRLSDRLGRVTEVRFSVVFDDTHLKDTPRLEIRYPISFETRINIIKGSFRRMRGAFRVT